ncbi:putative bifunctional diguanylate cyclase/phosphodiesterase [Uliginosibacterium paludis]|uniref:Bifunctional diguanylate cyclase/phosphodiesterase n=1 Tax=Uliginosibacterium paludis TaxID=1615952 RepID=A0ABV2CQR0_9RHOO
MKTGLEGAPITYTVQKELLRQAYRHQPGSIMVAIAAATGVSLLAHHAGLPSIWIWFAFMAIMSLIRMFAHLRFVRLGLMRCEDPVPDAWRIWIAVTQVASGVLWGLLAVVWSTQMHGEVRYATLIVLSALAGGATGVLAPLRTPARLFIGLVLLPPAVIFFLQPPTDPVLGFLAVVFFCVMIFAHHNNHLAMREALLLRAENSGLIDRLVRRTRESEALNHNLEEIVLARTSALEQMSQTDTLTGLPNRRWLLRELEARRGGEEPLVVMLLDLVRFKQINNRLGHEAGDIVLSAVAERIRVVLAPGQAVARWGGDEFVLLTFGADMGAKQLLQSIRKSLAVPIEVCGELQQIDIRAGVAVEGLHGDSGSELLGAADLALTELKRLGRGYFLFYRKELASRQRRRMDLAFDVLSAGDNNELRLAYQPVVSVKDGRVESLEALLRWSHPRFGNVPPEEFIPLVEESAAINTLGAWVLNRACSDAMRWQAGEGRLPGVAVNVSVIQLRDPLFVQRVADILSQTGLPPSRLDLEVTETVFEPDNAERISLSLAALSAMGIHIHVDDFGTGYSSLSRLHALPIDAIKIDRSFVAGLDTGATAIIEGAILIARRFGLTTIAEGVETLSQAAALHRLGVDRLQGYFICHPQAAARLMPVAPDWLELPGSLLVGAPQEN